MTTSWTRTRLDRHVLFEFLVVFVFKLLHPLCNFDGSSSSKSSDAYWLITREGSIWVTQYAQTRGRRMVCLPVPTST